MVTYRVTSSDHWYKTLCRPVTVHTSMLRARHDEKIRLHICANAQWGVLQFQCSWDQMRLIGMWIVASWVHTVTSCSSVLTNSRTLRLAYSGRLYTYSVTLWVGICVALMSTSTSSGSTHESARQSINSSNGIASSAKISSGRLFTSFHLFGKYLLFDIAWDNILEGWICGPG